MNNVEYALPGCMPPDPVNWESVIVTPEDGSLNLCVYCGEPGTQIHYTMEMPRELALKDPLYFKDNGYPEKKQWRYRFLPEFLHELDSLPEGAQVVKKPVRIYGKHMVPITETRVENPHYWLLQLPPGTLPYGAIELQIVVNNGRTRSYVLRHEYFSVHGPKWKERNKEYRNILAHSVEVDAGEETTVHIDLTGAGELLLQRAAEGSEYISACMYIDGEQVDLGASVEDRTLLLVLPAKDAGSVGALRVDVDFAYGYSPMLRGTVTYK